MKLNNNFSFFFFLDGGSKSVVDSIIEMLVDDRYFDAASQFISITLTPSKFETRIKNARQYVCFILLIVWHPFQ